MEMEVERGAVIPADGTTAPGLLDENPLDSLVTPGDRLPNAALATKPTIGVSMMDSGAVPTALPRDVVGRYRRRPPFVLDERLVLEVGHERMFADAPDGGHDGLERPWRDRHGAGVERPEELDGRIPSVVPP
jgi:hypothetical protein